jgi:hypothetical protein
MNLPDDLGLLDVRESSLESRPTLSHSICHGPQFGGNFLETLHAADAVLHISYRYGYKGTSALQCPFVIQRQDLC